MPDSEIEDTLIEEPTDDPVETVEPVGEPDAEAQEAEQSEEPKTFPRAYVEELRHENGKYRQRAAKADAYAQRLHTELVRATGKLADPTDLPFDEDRLGDPDALAAAVDDLLARKPHLVSRRPTGEIGQGATPSGTVDLAAILRQRAR